MSSVDLESLILVSVAAFFRIVIPFEVEDEDGEFWLKFKISARIFSSPAEQHFIQQNCAHECGINVGVCQGPPKCKHKDRARNSEGAE